MADGRAAPDRRGYADCWWRSADGLRLHYRDYAGPAGRLPILCIPGLTRNARDFERVADRLAATRRVIAVDLRGRGESEYAADARSYVPAVYAHDLGTLIATLDLRKLIVFGTSLGGLLTMLLAAATPALLAGALLNDIGPRIEPDGIARIRSYVGRRARWASWDEAAAAIARTHAATFPHYGAGDWLATAHRQCRADATGTITPDYDLAIAEPFSQPDAGVTIDLWPALGALAGIPSLLVRGALSDVLGGDTAAEMARRLPLMETLTLPDIGHAPMLDEPDCVAAIDRLLARIDRA